MIISFEVKSIKSTNITCSWLLDPHFRPTLLGVNINQSKPYMRVSHIVDYNEYTSDLTSLQTFSMTLNWNDSPDRRKLNK